MNYNAGDTYYGEFTTRFFAGGVSDADSLPVAIATKNGVDDEAFTLTVVKMDTGRYKITGTIPAYSNNDKVSISVSAVVDSIVEKCVIETFTIGLPDVTLATLQPNYAPAIAGAEMDLVSVPNSTAVTAIQNGLSKSSDDFNSTQKVSIKTQAQDGLATKEEIQTGLSTFDPSSDIVARVTLVDTTTDLTNAPEVVVTATVSAEDIRAALGMVTANLDDQLENIVDEISVLGIGTGPTPKDYYVYVDSQPCAGVLVVMTTDIAGTVKIYSGYTNAAGLITFYPDLPTGTTVYMWCYRGGDNFTNPDTEVIE